MPGPSPFPSLGALNAGLFQPLGPLRGPQGLDHLIQLPAEDAVERMDRQADAVVGAPTLWIIVGCWDRPS